MLNKVCVSSGHRLLPISDVNLAVGGVAESIYQPRTDAAN
jgi:hypothetical protein